MSSKLAFASLNPYNLSWSHYVSIAYSCPIPHRLSLAHRSRSRICTPRMDLVGQGIYAHGIRPEDVRVIVFGATGYIGRIVVREFCSQGYVVTAFARNRAGVGGKKTVDDIIRDLAPATVVFGEVTNPETLSAAFDTDKQYESTVVVSCLASRTGGVNDSNQIDYQATSNVLRAAISARVRHFVLLSAVCVQKPLLEFQRAKLKFEAELTNAAANDDSFSYSIVRPTAFFKSLAAQVDMMKNGRAYVMFNDGTLAKCNALSERDLARFIALCCRDESKRNKILPVGGPGKPVTPKEQADIVFKLLGREPKYWSVPIGLMTGIISILDSLASIFPVFTDTAEFAKIGKYYATEDMTGPSFGEDTLEQFFEAALKDGGMTEQELGDAKVLF